MKPAEVERIELFKFADFKKDDVVWDFGAGQGRYQYPVKKTYSTDMYYGIHPVEKIDKFLLLCVLHYNKRKCHILRKAYNQLKPGGHIIIIEPNPYNPFFYCLYFWRWLTRSKCPRRWSVEKHTSSLHELLKLLAETGFKNIETKKYAWFPSKFGWLKLNERLNEMPILGVMNAFNWLRAEK